MVVHTYHERPIVKRKATFAEIKVMESYSPSCSESALHGNKSNGEQCQENWNQGTAEYTCVQFSWIC